MKPRHTLAVMMLLVCLCIFGQQPKTVPIQGQLQKTSTQVSTNQHELILQLQAENEAMQKQLEIIESLKNENAKLQHDVDQLAELQYQNIRQFHDDISSDLSTYMTWVGILAALLTIIVAIVSILIPIRINNSFEARIKESFNDFRSSQKKQIDDSLSELENWKKALIKEQRSRFNKVIADVSNLKKDAKQSERKAWISQILSEAISSFNGKEYDKTIMLCNQVLKLDNRLSSAHNLKGIAFAEKKEEEKAIDSFNKAIELEPNNSGYIYNRAKFNYQSKRYTEALIDCNMAIRLEENSEFYTLRAAAKQKLQDISGALADVSKSIELNPNDAKSYFNRGFLKMSLGDTNGAIEDYKKHVELDPSNAEVYNSIAYAYMKIGQNDLAFDYVEKAILLTEEKNGCYIDSRGEVLMLMGKLNDAIKDFTSASVLLPNNYEPLEHRASCYRKLAEAEQDPAKIADLIAKAEADEKKAESLKKEDKV